MSSQWNELDMVSSPTESSPLASNPLHVDVTSANARTVELAPAPAANPFAYDRQRHRGILQTMKMILVGLVLVLPRLLLLLLSLTLIMLFCSIITCVAAPNEPRMPFAPTPCLRVIVRGLARVLLFALGFVWISVDDRSGDDGSAGHDDARVIVCNHCTFVDAFLMGYLRLPMPVGKAELLSYPIFGRIARGLQTIAVDRSSAQDRAFVAQEITRRATSTLDPNWPPILIFPEGTTVSNTTLVEFKVGAFLPMVPVQPIVLNYQRNWHLDLSWVGVQNPLLTVTRMMCQFCNRVDVVVLPVQAPLTGDAPQSFALRVQKQVASTLGATTTSHSLDDARLIDHAFYSGKLTAEEAERVVDNLCVKDVKAYLTACGKDSLSVTYLFDAWLLQRSEGMNSFRTFIEAVGRDDVCITTPSPIQVV